MHESARHPPHPPFLPRDSGSAQTRPHNNGRREGDAAKQVPTATEAISAATKGKNLDADPFPTCFQRQTKRITQRPRLESPSAPQHGTARTEEGADAKDHDDETKEEGEPVTKGPGSLEAKGREEGNGRGERVSR